MSTNVHHAHRIHHRVHPVVVRSRGAPAPGGASFAGRRHRLTRMAVVVAVVAVAAVALVAAIGLASVAIKGTPPAAGTLPATVTDADFTFRASDVCARLEARMATFGFRTDAAASELADARSRMDALGHAARAVRAIGEPASSPGLVDWVAGQLDLARLQAAAVLSAPTAEVAHYRWISVDPAIERAVAPLASIGAARCSF